MQKFKRFEQAKKIRTISVDTNVLSDAVYYFMAEKELSVGALATSRFAQSLDAIMLILSMNVQAVGIETVKKELKQKPAFVEIYQAVFSREVNVSKEIKWLTQSYLDNTGLKVADALIVAAASVGGIDLFLSWNRQDIINDATLQTVWEINKKRNVQFPTFATPEEFLHRVFITASNTICLSPTPTPGQYRPRFSLPK